jgi:hypothetical protein
VRSPAPGATRGGQAAEPKAAPFARRSIGGGARAAVAAAEPKVPRPEPSAGRAERTGWRSALVEWGAAALSAPERGIQPPPLDGAAPVIAVCERFGLEPAAVRALALLYAGWLLGHGRDGVPAAQVARAIGEDDDWRESLGGGQLARHGIARGRRGRLRLRRVVGRFLDGEPRRVEIVAARAAGATPLPSGGSVLLTEPSEPLERLAARLAASVGSDLALVALDEGLPSRRLLKRLRDGLFEARMAGAVPLVAWPRADLREALADRRWLESGSVILAVAPPRPPSLAALPELHTLPDATR